MQIALFALEPAPAPTPTWERIDGGHSKLTATYRHNPNGWTVHHCGHPTANFPYYLLTPSGSRLLAPNGRGFQTLALAQDHVERLHNGQQIADTGEDLRVYRITRNEWKDRKSVDTPLESVTSWKAANQRRNELQAAEDAAHPERGSWTRILFVLELETEPDVWAVVE